MRAVCSVIALAVVLERLLQLYRSRINTEEFMEDIAGTLRRNKIMEATPITKARAWCHRHARVKQILLTGMTTQVEVEVRLGNLTLRGNGLTRCGPSDEYSSARGINIAKGRASKAVAAQLVRTEMRPWDFA